MLAGSPNCGYSAERWRLPKPRVGGSSPSGGTTFRVRKLAPPKPPGSRVSLRVSHSCPTRSTKSILKRGSHLPVLRLELLHVVLEKHLAIRVAQPERDDLRRDAEACMMLAIVLRRV